MSELLTVAEVSEILGLGRSKTYEMVNNGTLPAVRLSERAVRVPRAQLNEWLQRKLAEGVKPAGTDK
jgi:excisionase family DNA binding protein